MTEHEKEQQLSENRGLFTRKIKELYSLEGDILDLSISVGETWNSDIDDCFESIAEDAESLSKKVRAIVDELSNLDGEREAIENGTKVYFDNEEEMYGLQNQRG
jgi:hypothetical protein